MNTYFIENIAYNQIKEELAQLPEVTVVLKNSAAPKWFTEIKTTLSPEEFQKHMPLKMIKSIPEVKKDIDYKDLKNILIANRCSFAIVK